MIESLGLIITTGGGGVLLLLGALSRTIFAADACCCPIAAVAFGNEVGTIYLCIIVKFTSSQLNFTSFFNHNAQKAESEPLTLPKASIHSPL
ncbi:MAG: hypothetical protein LBP31_00735, partial [Holosporales bacterium]|nr:hypothetical protein [Holosporales bacterium]